MNEQITSGTTGDDDFVLAEIDDDFHWKISAVFRSRLRPGHVISPRKWKNVDNDDDFNDLVEEETREAKKQQRGTGDVFFRQRRRRRQIDVQRQTRKKRTLLIQWRREENVLRERSMGRREE